MTLARQNLLQEKPRFALSVIGIALSIMIVLVLNGVLNGVVTQTGAYLSHDPGAVVVAPAGADNFLVATTTLPAGTEEAVRAAPGVAAVVPVLSKTAVLRLHDRREASFVIGYDPTRGGGPWRLAAGRAPDADDEAVLDRLLAERHGIGVGDPVEILGRAFTVVGISDETSQLMTSFVFLRKSGMEALVLASGASSFLLVTPEAGVSPAMLVAQLGGLPGARALLKRDLIDNDVKVFTNAFGPPIRLMAGIAFVVGTLVVGLVIFTATTERSREYGVLKAIGVRNALLYRLVATQAVITAAAGVALGMLFGFAAARLIMAARPQYLITLTAGRVAVAAVVGLVMAMIAALVPTRVIAGLAPANVLRR